MEYPTFCAVMRPYLSANIWTNTPIVIAGVIQRLALCDREFKIATGTHVHGWLLDHLVTIIQKHIVPCVLKTSYYPSIRLQQCLPTGGSRTTGGTR